jgi:type IV pilus assembly protein PilO
MGTAVIVLLTLLAGWFLLVSPKKASAADLRTQTASQESQNLTLAAQVATLKEQKAGLPLQEAKLATIRQRIPDNPALPPLLRSLSALAKASNVTIASLAPAPPGPNTSPVVNPSGTPATGVVPQLQTISLTINFSGSYANVELFLNKLESLKRSFLVTGLQMTGATGAGATGGTSSPTIAVIMAARVFDASTIGVAPTSPSAGGASTSGTTTAQ